jgi:hypothetical protein
MSERDTSIGCLGMIVVTVFVAFLILWVLADYAEIRDLQRRVGQLEERVK